MSSGVRYTEEFKRDAVAQVVDRGYSVLEAMKTVVDSLRKKISQVIEKQNK